jgi:hypothetical protein
MNWERHFRAMKPPKTVARVRVSFGAEAPKARKVGRMADLGFHGLFSNADDMNAINDYMMASQPATPSAVTLKDNWVTWWNGLGMFSNFGDANYDEARNRRNAYDLANATTAAQVAQVHAVMTGGQSTEQDSGVTDRRLSDGSLPKGPLIPVQYQAAAEVAGVATLVLIVLRKLHIL